MASREPPADPLGIDGFDFIEFATPDPDLLGRQLRVLGFARVGRHHRRRIELFRQGDIRFVVNGESGGLAGAFARLHGPSVCGLALRVRDAAAAHALVGARGATALSHAADLPVPAIAGIGGAALYLSDAAARERLDEDFAPTAEHATIGPVGLAAIDHLTHNVHRGRLDAWCDFYRDLFGFSEVRNFRIAGRRTGLRSRAMASPDGRTRIPINESVDDDSQIEEFISLYKGEGVQHIALSSPDICASVEALGDRGLRFMAVPDDYYDHVDERLPGHGEDLRRLRRDRVLIDGGTAQGGGKLLQIFTQPIVGPIFFEIIQRHGNDGFGEGNFQALFDSIERDQLARGVIRP